MSDRDMQRAGAAAELSRALDRCEELHEKLVKVKSQRDEARAVARVLAHSYEHDSRPPAEVVRDALAFPIMPEPL